MKLSHLFFCMTLLSVLCACHRHTAGTSSEPVVKTDTVRVYQQNVTATFPGKVKAASDLDIAFKVSGTLLRMPARQGTFVRKGTLIAEMDDRDYRTQLSATEAEYNQIRNEASRVMELYEKQSASKSDYEKALYGLQQISAKYEAHRNALADTRLYAPFDGYIEQVYFDAHETVSAGMPVISMINAGLPEVEINIPSADYMRRADFESFECRIELYPGRSYPLELIGLKQKANLNQLYTMVLRMLPVSYEDLPTPGMSAMVTITYRSEENARMQLPAPAVFALDGKSCVWVYNPDTQTVDLRNVTVESLLDNGTMVIRDGVRAGEIVVTAGVHAVEQGQKVRLLPPVSATNIGGLL